VGLYFYGSLASGDFNPDNSDIDFIVVTDTYLPDEMVRDLEALHVGLWNSGLKWATKLEGAYVPLHSLRRYDPDSAPCPTINEGRFYLDKQGSDWIIQRYILREYGAAFAARHDILDRSGDARRSPSCRRGSCANGGSPCWQSGVDSPP
jgi:hypothetical protein